MKLCAIVVTYYPDVDETTENIMRYLNWVDKFIIWENTPKKDIDQHKFKFSDSDKVIFHGIGENVGISRALNWAVDYAINNGYTHLLTMDQDSKWVDFEAYKLEIEKKRDRKIAAFAPLIYDAVRNQLGYNTEKQFITSGAVYSLEVSKFIGNFCKEFYIDCVDTEYALRIQLNCLKVEIIHSGHLIQNFGNIKKVPFLNCYHANYSNFRVYHIIRNNLWMWRMYRKTGLLSKNFLIIDILYKFFLRELILNTLVGKNKIKNYNALIKGLFTGLFRYPSSLNSYVSRNN